MAEKKTNVNPEIAMARGICPEDAEAISDAMIDASDNAGIDKDSSIPQSVLHTDFLSDVSSDADSVSYTLNGGKNKDKKDIISSSKDDRAIGNRTNKREKLVELFVSNPDVEDGAYFILSINLREFKIEFNKPCMVPEYVRDYYYSLSNDMALNNKRQNSYADKNPI